MIYDSGVAVNQLVSVGMYAVNAGFKIGGETAKAVLLVTLEKIKENKQNRAGLRSLKELVKSKDELNILNLKKDQLSYFKKRCKKFQIPFGAVSGPNEDVKILYKSKDVNMVKDILKDMLTQEKANKLDELQEMEAYNSINKNMDFNSINDTYYRYNVEKVTNEKATALSSLLKINGIENDIVVRGINEDNSFIVDYRFDKEFKDKASEILNTNKDKEIEEILNEIDKIRKLEYKDGAQINVNIPGSEIDSPKIVDPAATGLAKYGVIVEQNILHDKFNNKKIDYILKLGDKKINHLLDEKHYLTISDNLRRLGFTSKQISELKESDSFVKERFRKEQVYENILNKKNEGKEPLDFQISKAKNISQLTANIDGSNKSKEKGIR